MLAPNLLLLPNALYQIEGLDKVDARSWARRLQERIETLDASKLGSDVSPFLERPQDAVAITVESLRSGLQE